MPIYGMLTTAIQFSTSRHSAKLFFQQCKSTTSSPTNFNVGTDKLVTAVPNHSSTSHLQRTVADEIIKKPTYFHGSKDDVRDWLEKLKQRFTMANWNDEQKLRYISIHWRDDAYRWWIETATSIKTWSSFIVAITQPFGSAKIQELAFEQLKWYKQTINQSITQYYDKIIELCTSRLFDNIRIPTKQTSSIPVFIELLSANVIFRPSFKFKQRISLLTLNSSLKVHDSTSNVSLYNPTDYSCSLPKGLILGITTIPTLSFKKNSIIDYELINTNITYLIQHITGPDRHEKIKSIIYRHSKLFDTSKYTIATNVKPRSIRTLDHPSPA
ncbi:unnamed protein product [Rotaria sp. Silwood2]|nr:unnamed protein product [Rotaria sp. Silwood2]